MALFRVVMILEAFILLGCGILCLAVPDLISMAGSQPTPPDTYMLFALGLALISLAALLFGITTNPAKFPEITLTCALVPTLCVIGLATIYTVYRFTDHPTISLSIAIGLSILTLTLLPNRVAIVSAEPSPPSTPHAPLKPAEGKFEEKLAFHQAQMKFAWDWFHYHADQRLKAFNYFVLFLGILIVAYGAAMKESRAAAATTADATKTANKSESEATPKTANDTASVAAATAMSYGYFAAWVAAFGAIISIAFLLIEVRNSELVECGRTWLDYLEDGLDMKLRKNDRDRLCLPSAVGLPPTKFVALFEVFVTHKTWMRLIYLVAIFGFVVACFYAQNGFK